MKHVMRTLSFLLMVAITLSVISCGKDGDAGPAGPAGANGANGPAGPAGPKGDPGTANVIYSNWLDVPFLPQTVTTNGKLDTLGYLAAIDVPKLTKELLSNAEVKVYVNLNIASDPVIAPLPYADEDGVIIRFVAFEKTIQFSSNVDAGTFLDRSNFKSLQYRYMIIPGGTAARAAGNVDWNNYAAVKTYLGLND